MKFQHLSVLLASLSIVAGCATASDPQPAAAATDAAAQAPALSDEAKAAMAQAEASIKASKSSNTLWVPADAAFKAVQEAAKKGDSEAVIKQAKKVADYNRMSAAQVDYPSTEMK